MFWSGNYIAVRELNSLLKEENVTLSQVLEADDILQECKADNKALIQFLTKPEILADLITLITEEPPKNVELATQYRYANIACEVLTSHLSMLSDRLSLDAAQMNRLCDFLNQDPPLNPLLASYFSKTVEMLLEKSPKQDWCLHHIVCLRVLDFFKSRRDFLPNLLRHMSTSAIADVFKYLMRIDDLIKTVMEWLEEHQFLECLIQIICGTYVAEALSAAPEPDRAQAEAGERPPADHADHTADGAAVNADGDKELANADSGDKSGSESAHTEAAQSESSREAPAAEVAEVAEVARRARSEADERAEAESAAAAALAAERTSAAASANAAALLCDLIINGCRPRTGWVIVSRLQSVRSVVAALQAERGVRTLLQAMFTSPPHARRHALVNGTQVLLALLHHDPPQLEKGTIEEEAARTYAVGTSAERSGVELGVAPHLPLLHQALLHEPSPGAVGLARVQVAALLAHLALSEVEEVAATMLTLGTPGVLVDMFFQYPNNNFLHAQVYTLLKHALTNRVYRTQYARHLLVECDLLSRLMDVFEENKSNKEAALAGGLSCGGKARAAYMGHGVLALALCARALDGDAALAHAVTLPAPAAQRWPAFREQLLRPLLQHHDMPLGGYYPSENFYEVEIMPDPMATNYDFNDIGASGNIDELADDINADDAPEMCGAAGSAVESADFIADGLGIDDSDKLTQAKNDFLELASQRFGADMWDDSGDADENDLDVPSDVARDVLDQQSPWESADSGACGGEGWAHFGSAPTLLPHDPFAPAPPASPPPSPHSPRRSPRSPRSPHSPRSPATPPADDHFAEFSPYWSYDTQPIDSNSTTKLESNLGSMRLDGELPDAPSMDSASSASLANNLLTAMSAMSPDAIANIVNANLPSPPSPPAPSPAPAPSPKEGQAGQEHR